jgi:hypothetical protein
MSKYCPVAHEGGRVKLVVVKYCPACRGGARSHKKAEAARENGKLGGRPRKTLDAVAPSARGGRGKISLEVSR